MLSIGFGTCGRGLVLNWFLRVVVILGLSTLFYSSAWAQGGSNVRFDHLSIEDGLSQSTVFAILQDQYGFMWFGTQDGLNRYDGYTFTVFKHNPEDPATISDNFIRALYEDQQGVLWIGTNGGLNQFDRATQTFTRYQHKPGAPQSLSHNIVRTIYEDQQGVLWIGTNAGLNRFDSANGSFIRYQHNPNNPTSLSHDTVRTIYEGQDRTLWIGTEGGGLNRFDPTTETFAPYRHHPDDPNTLSHDDISTIHGDHAGILWITTEGGGLNKFDPVTEKFVIYQNDPDDPDTIQDDNLRYIYQDQTGLFWIGTWGGGLNRFEPETETFISYQYDPANPHSLSGNQVLSIYEDRGRVFWVGTNGAGLNKFNRATEVFAHFTNTANIPQRLSDNMVWSIVEDQNELLWVGTSNGLNKIDRATGVITSYNHSPDDPASLSSNFVPVVLEDHAGIIWVGTDEGGLNRFDPLTETFTTYRHNPDDPNSLSDDDIWSMYEDRSGNLWLGTWGGGLNKFNPASETITHYIHELDNPHSVSDNVIRVIRQDQSGILWLGTNGAGLDKFDPETETFTHYVHNPEDLGSLSDNVVRAIYEDRNQILWIGTDGGGLNRFDPTTESFTHYREQQGLPNDTIYGILEDDQGYLWLSTNNGLSKFNPGSETFKNYNVSDGLQSNEFNQGAYYKSQSGELFFGGINGFNAFYPQQIEDNPHIPQVVLTSFQIFNKEVKQSQPLVELADIQLSYRDSVFSFEFAALDYTAPLENQYAYMLEGFDTNWIEAGTRRFATYTNLDGGDYVFKVKGSNNDGVWTEAGVRLNISISPPFWKTWWAYGLYLLASITVVAGYARYRTQAQAKELTQQRKELEQERMIADQLRRIDRLKDEFLANTSHELRTPLNGIMGLAESLADGAAGDLPEKARADLAMIASSGRRLTNLVNDVLDYSKLAHRQLDLNLKSVDLRGIAEVVLTLCRPLVGQKAVQLVNNIADEIPPVMADENRVEQILYNLVGNAVKFTESGTVAVTAQADGEYLIVAVSDTGIGIPIEKQPQIFESFVQADGSTDRAYGGTGLGLSITKQLVELHGGTLQVESVENEGSQFTFSLPITERPPVRAAGRHTASIAELEDFGYEATSLGSVPVTVPVSKKGKFHILVVDDEPVNQKVLSNYLALHDCIITAAMSGDEALKLIENGLKPDLILLDIMMPRLSGYEVCRQLRQTYTLSQLPILMLTAKNQPQDMIAGFEAGANDFLAKPFDRSELLARVNTLLIMKEAIDANDQLIALEKELEIAHRIQQSILPEQVPDLPDLDIQVCYIPMADVGGDYYDFYKIDDHQLAVLVADVTGHGIPAALIASMVKIAFSVQQPIARSISDVLTNMNQTLVDRVGYQFLTASYIYLNLDAGQIYHSNAGHFPLLVWKKQQQTLHQLKPDGFIMGWQADAVYPSADIEIEPGDRVILYTDAVVETRNSTSELFGDARFLSLIKEKQDLSAAEFIDFVLDHLHHWSGQGSSFEDDLTLIIIDVLANRT